jgi:uncharacterized SAM-binding protein YcdF (DUF218 family)
MPGPVSPFDVAIVLGASIAPDGGPSPALARRVACAVDLAVSGQVGALLMSGGPVRHPIPEALVMRDLALAAGVSSERIFVETSSRNTIGNARHCRPIVEVRGWQRILVVTDSHHLPRALYTFRRFGLRVSGASVPCSGGSGWGWWLGWGREMLALPWTVIRLERLRLRAVLTRSVSTPP